MDISILVTSALASTALSSAWAWFLNHWLAERIKHEYDVKLEQHKSELRAAMDREIETHKANLQVTTATAVERLRADLQIESARRQIRFSRSHDRQASTIYGVYKRLRALLRAFRYYVTVGEYESDPPKAERRKMVADAMEALTDFMEARDIYLPHDLGNKVRAFHDQILQSTQKFMLEVEEGRDVKVWTSIFASTQRDLQPVLTQLKLTFQELLGVLEHEPAP